MKVIDTRIPDVKIIEPTVFTDDRGFFYESFNQRKFEAAIGRSVSFVQDNHSLSTRGVLRGLHYQLPPFSQAKLVRVVAGEVFDVAVDIRRSSPSFGQWVGVNLSDENKRQFWIPEGFAHGFLVLSESAQFLYKASDFYAPGHERSLLWNDGAVGIQWPLSVEPVLAMKDAAASMLAAAELFD